MRDLQKIGGAAALIEAATYVIGLGLFFTFLAPYYGFVPALKDTGAVFGLGMIVWWAWLGIAMLGSGAAAVYQKMARI